MEMDVRDLKLIMALLLIVGAVPHFANAQKKSNEKVIVPAWKIQIVDDTGKPMKGVFVRQFWQDYDIEDYSHEEDAHSDENGYVSFPERRERSVSKLARSKKRLKHFRELGVHASDGVYAYILAWGEIVGCKRLEGSADYEVGKLLPTRLQMRVATLPGFKCLP